VSVEHDRVCFVVELVLVLRSTWDFDDDVNCVHDLESLSIAECCSIVASPVASGPPDRHKLELALKPIPPGGSDGTNDPGGTADAKE